MLLHPLSRSQLPIKISMEDSLPLLKFLEMKPFSLNLTQTYLHQLMERQHRSIQRLAKFFHQMSQFLLFQTYLHFQHNQLTQVLFLYLEQVQPPKQDMDHLEVQHLPTSFNKRLLQQLNEKKSVDDPSPDLMNYILQTNQIIEKHIILQKELTDLILEIKIQNTRT